MLKQQIIKLANEAQIDDIGFADGSEFDGILPNAKTVIVYVLSYFAGNDAGNISRYARGEDYHTVMARVASPICELLSQNGYTSKQYADASPLPERLLAVRVGLGVIGKNQALIHPKFGSYIFIGCILTDWDASVKTSMPLKQCIGCNKCVTACPSGALNKDAFDAEKCVSHLTQKKGELTSTEIESIKNSGYLWGCDICQEVCPMNKDIPICKHDEFTKGLIYNLPNVDGLSNKEFLKAYPGRAFTWRGKAVINRNNSL